MSNVDKLILSITFFSSLILVPLAHADKAAEVEAEKLLSMVGMEASLEQSMLNMVDIQIQQNPGMAIYKSVMLAFFQKHMSYQSLKPDLVLIYANTFTATELKKIREFYATDVGKKSIEKMPTLMAQGAQLGVTRVQANIGNLQAMIAAETKRLEKAGQQSTRQQ